jgi:hypothetical protein
MSDTAIYTGKEVLIISVSDGQCHLAPGDGETYFVGKRATVRSVDTGLGRIWVEPEKLGYVLWFSPKDIGDVPEA